MLRKEYLLSEMNEKWDELRETVKKLQEDVYSVGIDISNEVFRSFSLS